MSTYKRSNIRDLAIANEAQQDLQLMCEVAGCPNRWAYSEGIGPNIRGICTAHHLAARSEWPQVTEQELDRESRRLAGRYLPQAQVPHLTVAQRSSLVRRLKSVLAEPKNPRAWIERLRDKVQRGEPLSAAQRDALARVGNIPEEVES